MSVSAKSKGQGALEYLVIIAAVIAILAVVVTLLSQVGESKASSVAISACKQAASQCKVVHYTVPKDPCPQCQIACNSSGTEVFPGAVNCCVSGRPEDIYQDSPGCFSLELFYDEFNTLDAWEGDISSSLWHVSSTFAYNGTNSAFIDAYGMYIISHAQSTLGYKNIEVSFWAYNNLQDLGEILRLEWFDGSTWTSMGDLPLNSNWLYYSYLLPPSADNNPNFAIRLVYYDWHTVDPSGAIDWVYVDTLRIKGDAI